MPQLACVNLNLDIFKNLFCNNIFLHIFLTSDINESIFELMFQFLQFHPSNQVDNFSYKLLKKTYQKDNIEDRETFENV